MSTCLNNTMYDITIVFLNTNYNTILPNTMYNTIVLAIQPLDATHVNLFEQYKIQYNSIAHYNLQYNCIGNTTI